MLVSYTYRSDDQAPSEGNELGASKAGSNEVKTFGFYTVVELGPIIARESIE